MYKTVVNKAIDEVSDSVGMQCSQAGHASEMKALIDKLERAGWAVWALETSDKISPVAMGKVADQNSVAMAKLQEAFDMITSVLRQVRSTRTSARQQGLLIDSKDTLAKLGKELLQLCKIMEDLHMQQFSELLFSGDDVTVAQIKSVLTDSAETFKAIKIKFSEVKSMVPLKRRTQQDDDE